MNKIFLQTFGCQMNEYDSELVRAILSEAGYSFTEDAQLADVVMLNTCSVRENAHRKVYGLIHDIRHGHKGKPVVIGILGCMATGLRKELIDNKSLGLDFVVGPDSYKRLPEILRDVFEKHGQGYDVTLSEFETYSDIYPTRTGGVNAWVAVMRGCNNFCSFCIVPFTRGRERSRSVENVLDEVKRLIGEGFQQVTLLGQNVNSYHHEGQDFAALLEAVSRIDGIRRIRFTSPHPKDFPESLIRVVGENPKICKHIHLPLQSGNDRILGLMNRHYTATGYLNLVEKIRKVCPSAALTTDIIVGFPTEIAGEFEDTVRVMKAVEFDSAFMFKYSPRPNTQAARELKDDVSEDEKTSRIMRINTLQSDISLKKNKARVGTIEEVLIEDVEKAKGGVAYARNDVNKVVALPAGNFQIGDFMSVRIIRATPHQLKGEIIS
ncbi:MAG: tRNA (N6-isopentenyl adenosine(37)-C2)-methylthiotransferase MiaB [Candidatus Omnitrophica bacterium]|nr:tRNA (N6-isopentenyl adenosine(37)-C2)-methylthiotransferase MiaB [Candidatus Omnitrophota bacterium]